MYTLISYPYINIYSMIDQNFAYVTADQPWVINYPAYSAQRAWYYQDWLLTNALATQQWKTISLVHSEVDFIEKFLVKLSFKSYCGRLVVSLRTISAFEMGYFECKLLTLAWTDCMTCSSEPEKLVPIEWTSACIPICVITFRISSMYSDC